MTDLQKKVIEIVCSQMGVEEELIFSDSKKRTVTLAKHVCMYVFKNKFGMGYEKISEMFPRSEKKMNHTSVIHAVRSVQNGIDVNDDSVTRPVNHVMNCIDEYFNSQNIENISNVLLISFHPNFPINKIKDLIKSNYPTVEYEIR